MQVKEATKCTASVGIGPNMLLAKLATNSAKPDGVFRIHPGGDTDRSAQVDCWFILPESQATRPHALCVVLNL